MAIIGQKRRGAGLGQKLPQQIAEVGNKIYSGFSHLVIARCMVGSVGL